MRVRDLKELLAEEDDDMLVVVTNQRIDFSVPQSDAYFNVTGIWTRGLEGNKEAFVLVANLDNPRK